jgi:catechol-2,3-dioxygenase
MARAGGRQGRAALNRRGAQPNLAKSRIGQIAVVCKDVARASAFYRDVLGLPPPVRRGAEPVVLQLRWTRLMPTIAERPQDDHQLDSLL